MKLAIMGVSGSGKDYVVDVMKKDYGFARLSFSDQLKKLGAMIYPWLKSDYTPDEKEVPLNITIPETGELITKTPREIWLELNKMRNVEDHMFVRMLAHEMSLIHGTDIVISDIRTQNEYDWCKENDFTIIAIKGDAKHPENSFDDWVRDMIDMKEYDYEFTNEFDGPQKVKEFIESCFI